jgi:glucose/arabinose dehydrogenase
LLGVAFHPRFAENGFVYVSYTAPGAPLTSVVARFNSPDRGVTMDVNSETALLTLPQPFANHNGGHIVFGSDGMLYVGFGDGGSEGDPNGNGQDTNTLLGKILRLDVDNAAPYAIPGDNPFAGGGGRGEIWAFGLRNPWRFQFDRGTGALWAGDVGQNQFEEVDRITRGGNFGWNIREGAHCFSDPQCSTAGLIDPVAEYDHTEGCSITGGFVYRGSAIPSLSGSYVYGDFCSGRIWALANEQPQVIADTTLAISSFAEDSTGELLVIDMAGQIYGLRAGSSSAASSD